MSEQTNQNINNENEDKVNSSTKENSSNGKSNINDDQNGKKENKKDNSQFHYILFHDFSKDKKKNENSKNSGTIQSIVINKNLRISLAKIKNQMRGLSNKSKNIYYRKSLTKGNCSLNSNLLSKKNMTTSQSLVNTKMDTNYDYDSDNKQNYNILNYFDNSDKFSILEKKNYFIDVSLKEYLQNEAKNIRSARHNYENKENINNNENNSIKKDDKKENCIQKVVDLRLNSEVIPYTQKQKTQRSDNHKKQEIKNKHKSLIRAKFKSLDSKGSNFKKCKSNKNNFNYNINTKHNSNNQKSLIKKSYSLLSSEGNFLKKPKFIEEEKNNSRKLNQTKNFYNNISKIDYISFREKKIINENPKTSKIKERNIFKNKNNKKIPCKLFKKDTNNIIISSSRIASLINSMGIKNSSRSKNKNKKMNKTTRNISIDLDICENLNSYKNETINMNAIIKSNNLADLCKTDDSKETNCKKSKKKIFEFKKRDNKKKLINSNENGNEINPLLSIKMDFKNLLEKQNDDKAKEEKKDQ